MLRAVAILPDATARRRAADALAASNPAGHPALTFATGWREARQMGLSSPIELLVFDPYASGDFQTEPVARYAEQFSSCGLVAYARFPHGCARDMFELSRAGVHGVVARDVDDPPASFSRVLLTTLERRALGQSRSMWQSRTPPTLSDLLPRLLAAPQDRLTPADVARMCHAHPKTIRTHLRRAGLPALGKLIVWSRLLRACQLLQDTARSVENVALVLGFASANSFRNQLLRYTRLCPTQVRCADGLKVVLLRFGEALQPGASAAGGSGACGPALSACASGFGEGAILGETALHA